MATIQKQPTEEKNIITPSIDHLIENSNGTLNRYSLVIATAKTARALTEKYVQQREYARKLRESATADKSLVERIKRDYPHEKAVPQAVDLLDKGEFIPVLQPDEEVAEEETSAETAEEQ